MVGSMSYDVDPFPFGTTDFAVLHQQQHQPDTTQADHVSVLPTEGDFSAVVMGRGDGNMQFGDGDYLVGSAKMPLVSASAPPPPPAHAAEPSLSAGVAADGLNLPASDLLMAGAAQWDEVLVARQAAADLQRELERTAKERDEACMAVSTLRNELYAARQVEKRLRGERDEARGQVGFLRRERAAARQTEFRLRKERDQARLVTVLGKRVGKKTSLAGAGVDNDMKLVAREGDAENAEWVELLDDTAGQQKDGSPALCSPFEEIFGLPVDKT